MITDDEFLKLCKKHDIYVHSGAQFSIKCQIAQLMNLIEDVSNRNESEVMPKVFERPKPPTKPPSKRAQSPTSETQSGTNNLIKTLIERCNRFEYELLPTEAEPQYSGYKMPEKGVEVLANNGGENSGYAYENIEEYEKIVNTKVGESFKLGWAMARLKMDDLKKVVENSGGNLK